MNIAFAGLRHDHIYALANRLLADERYTVTGAWEEDETAAERGRKVFGRMYPDYDALLGDKAVDIVAIGDYYGIRGERILRALNAGKHVIVDKPVCTSLAELDRIEEKLHKSGLKMGSMLDLRYDPALNTAADIMREGSMGEVRSVMFTGRHPLNYGTRPQWYFEKGRHGGTFNDIAIHGLDAVRMITGFGYEKTAFARQWNCFAKEEPGFLDSAQFMGELSNGAALMADVSYSAPDGAGFSLPGYWRFEFYCENGWIEAKLGAKSIQIAYKGDAGVTLVPAREVDCSSIDDLVREIRGERTAFDTASVITAARDALSVQAAADDMNRH